MELQFYGANCLRLTTKKASVVIDDNLAKLGQKSVTKKTDISLRTNSRIPESECVFMADMPGEYEISGLIITGIAMRAHMDPEGEQNAVSFVVEASGIKTVFLGHIHPDLTEEQQEKIANVDIAVVPVGNSGYTLDAAGASGVIKKIEPKIIIPTHYQDDALKYEVPQAPLEEAVKAFGVEPQKVQGKYKPTLPETSAAMQLVVLER